MQRPRVGVPGIGAIPMLQAPNNPAVAIAEEAAPRRRTGARKGVLATWLLSQPMNQARHAAALRPFTRNEFGDGPEAPSEAHVKAVNALMHGLRRQLLAYTRKLKRVSRTAGEQGTTPLLHRAVTLKERGHA